MNILQTTRRQLVIPATVASSIYWPTGLPFGAIRGPNTAPNFNRAADTFVTATSVNGWASLSAGNKAKAVFQSADTNGAAINLAANKPDAANAGETSDTRLCAFIRTITIHSVTASSTFALYAHGDINTGSANELLTFVGTSLIYWDEGMFVQGGFKLVTGAQTAVSLSIVYDLLLPT